MDNGYPTLEEEYELMYGDELQMMDEPEYQMEPVAGPSSSTQEYTRTPKPGPSSHDAQRTQFSEDIFMESPVLSQIPRSATAKRLNLDGTPMPHRGVSTPIAGRKGIDPREALFLDSIDKRSSQIEINHNSNNSKKRRLGALFEDVFYHEEIEDQVQKKMKQDEERDQQLIRRILEVRLQNRNCGESKKSDDLIRLQELEDFKRRNLSLNLPNWPFTTVKRSDGERIYIRTHSEEFEKKELEEIGLKKIDQISILGDNRESIWNGAKEIIEQRLNAVEKNSEEPEIIEIDPQILQTDLWVEKYRPKKYIDLISDEFTNRTILQWLKMWDKVVFNKEPKSIAENAKNPKLVQKTLNSFNKTTGKFESTGGWQSKRKPSNLNTNRDDLGRPVQKVILISGSPGLGKTTLAHVIAKHAGYNIRELNASDDRSVEAFRLVLENGTQMQSLLSSEKRPNCIILDEIDGAPAPAIEFLIRFISDKVGTAERAFKKKKGKDSKMVLRRPIICICNDIYAPALRQLRQIAFVVNFPPVSSGVLADRLFQISKREKIKTDLGTLLVLAEKTGCDIRSCISMMQFFGAAKKPLTLHDVLKSNIGQKDQNKSLFQIWSSIFQIQRPKRVLSSNDEDQNGEVIAMSDMSLGTRMQNVLDLVQSNGDYERLMQGIYENFLTQKFFDTTLKGTAESIDWFTFSDRVQRMINQLQNYNIYPYLQFGFVIWHFNFGSLNWPTLTFPSKGYEMNQKTQSQKLVFSALRHGMSPTLKGVGEGQVILMDSIPFIRHILCPHIRSVSEHLLTSSEKTDLQHTVNIMVDLGLTYSQIQMTEGQFKYQLEPDLEFISTFPEVGHESLNYWTCQLVSREVQEECIRRATPKAITNDTNQQNKGSRSKDKEINIGKNVLQKSKDFSNIKEVVVTDFFGRTSVKWEPLSVHEGGTDLVVKSPIWFRFKEGYNNAVRRDITISDLL